MNIDKLIESLNDAYSALTRLDNEDFNPEAVSKVATMFGLEEVVDRGSRIVYTKNNEYVVGEHGKGFHRQPDVNFENLPRLYVVYRSNQSGRALTQFLGRDDDSVHEYYWGLFVVPALFTEDEARIQANIHGGNISYVELKEKS